MSQVEIPIPKVLDALAKLDPANDSHWTNDGLPKTSVVQQIAKDTTIQRPDIQNARPGFDREAAKALAQTDPLAENFEGDPAQTEAPKPVVSQELPGDNKAVPVEAETVEISDEQLVALLDKRIKTAEDKITNGRQQEADAQLMQNQGHDELRAARRDKNKYFPPITQSENVKSYIEASNAERAERVRQQGAASHLDALRRPGGGSINRGYGRGASRGAYSRQEAARLGFRVPGTNAPQGGPRA
jgi:hypothetical protein